MRRMSIIAIAAAAAILALARTAQGYTGEEPPFGTPPKMPHLYANGMMTDEHGKTIVGWGVIEMSNNITGPVRCKSVLVGHLANELASRTVEGKPETYVGPGKGQLYLWRPFECVGPGTSLEINASGEWMGAELVEPKGGPAKLALRGVTVTIRRGASQMTGTGDLQPNVLGDGISIGSAPEEAAFDSTTGELPGGIYTPYGRLKFEGFASQELLTVKSP